MGQHGVKIGVVFRALFQFGRQPGTTVIQHLHVKAARPLSQCAADAAHAEDADALPGDANAQQVALADAVTPALAHDTVILGAATGRGQQQHHGMIGGAFVQHAGGIGHHHPTRPRRGNIDMVVPDAAGCADANGIGQARDGGGGRAAGCW